MQYEIDAVRMRIEKETDRAAFTPAALSVVCILLTW